MLFAALLSAANAGFRYAINGLIQLSRDFHFLGGIQTLVSWYGNNSNAWLEIQWYMFAGMVMLGAAWTLKVNEHVRVDLVYGMVSASAPGIWIDLLGGTVLPAAALRHPDLFHLALVRRVLAHRRRSRPTPAACCAGRSS